VLPQEKVCTRVLIGSPTTLQTRYWFPFNVPLPNSYTCLNKILSFNQHSHDLWNKSHRFCCLALPRMSCTLVWHTDILILNECRPEWTILLFHEAHLHMARHGHFDPQTIIVSLESIVFLC
jgi:hypothetical protein